MRSRPGLWWQVVETRRRKLKLSRAELARRTGLSESTIYKGLHGGTRPERHTRQVVELALAMAEQLRRDAVRHRQERRP